MTALEFRQYGEAKVVAVDTLQYRCFKRSTFDCENCIHKKPHENQYGYLFKNFTLHTVERLVKSLMSMSRVEC